MGDVTACLRSDAGVQSMVRLYAVLNDWYQNIRQEKRGVRACERVTRIRDDGLVPLSQRYFEYVASEHGQSFDGDAEQLLQEWEDEFRPDYVAESESHEWDDYGRGLQRALVDAESRLGDFAVRTGISVNDATINIYDEDVLSAALQDEFESLWKEWFHRLDDLYWERRGRLYKQLVNEIEGGYADTEEKTWSRYRDRYPEFPHGTQIGDSTHS